MSVRMVATAIAVEGRKVVASRVLTSTAVMLVVGVAAIAAGSIAAAHSGNAQLAAKVGPLGAEGGWAGMVNVATQVTAAAGFGAFGVGLSWMYGREFADGTITGLFGLPVSRAMLAVAKLVVYLVWTVVTALVLTLVVALTAAVVVRQAPDSAAWSGLARMFALAVMNAALAVPAAWAATVGRGLLPAIGTSVALMAVTEIVVVSGGDWFPLAAPALWAVLPGSISAAQLLPAAVVPLAFVVLTLHAWRRLQLDR
jgi:ABC-2 type transport system permease protein